MEAKSVPLPRPVKVIVEEDVEEEDAEEAGADEEEK